MAIVREASGPMCYLLTFAVDAMAMSIAATDVFPGIVCHPDPVGYFYDPYRR
jgi:hypothetical protein